MCASHFWEGNVPIPCMRKHTDPIPAPPFINNSMIWMKLYILYCILLELAIGLFITWISVHSHACTVKVFPRQFVRVSRDYTSLYSLSYSRIREIHISIFWTHDVFEGHTILLLCYCFVLPCFVFISTFISIFSKFTKPILRDSNISWKYDHPPLQFHFDGIFLSSRVNATSLLFDSSSKLVYNVNVYCKLITSLSQRYTKDPYL